MAPSAVNMDEEEEGEDAKWRQQIIIKRALSMDLRGNLNAKWTEKPVD